MNRPQPTFGAQRGASLIFALMVLVVLSMAAVGLVRSVNTGALIAGNLSFKRDTSLGAAAAAEQPVAWLQTQAQSGTVLDADNTAKAYYASSMDDLDVTGTVTSAARPLQIINWDGHCLGLQPGTYSTCTIVPFVGTPVNGNRVQWVITRLCDFDGAMGPANYHGIDNLCTRPATQFLSDAPDKGSIGLSNRLIPIISTPYYRVITRVEGARNTVSYVETLIHF